MSTTNKLEKDVQGVKASLGRAQTDLELKTGNLQTAQNELKHVQDELQGATTRANETHQAFLESEQTKLALQGEMDEKLKEERSRHASELEEVQTEARR